MKVFKNFFLSLKNYSNFQKLNNLEKSIIFYVESKRDWDHLEGLYIELKKNIKREFIELHPI